jgi:hypothetical protein
MEHVYFIQATEEQFNKLMNFLDVVLKKQGLEVIQDAVDVYNVLVSANKVPISALKEALPQELVKAEDSEG